MYHPINMLFGVSDPFGRTLTLLPTANGKISQVRNAQAIVAFDPADKNTNCRNGIFPVSFLLSF
jgi:hypothetical protein